jgi:hypothetical protein
MASSYSTNLALTLPVQGELSGTWGTTVNTGITNMVDEALGYQAYSATGGSDTLTIPDGATGVARSIYIQLNGTGGGTVNVPTTKTKMYFVFNNTASAITFKVTGQTGVSIPAAAKMALVSNGTDIIVAQNHFAALTLGAALPVASGGTNLTSFTSGGVVYASSSSALATGSALTFDGTNLGVGVTPSAWATITGLQVKNASLGGFSNSMYLMSNVYYDGSAYRYLATAGAAQYAQIGGDHRFLSASSGTAGNVATLTQTMILTPEGNLGLGVTPSAWFANSKVIQIGQGSAIEGRTNDASNITLGGNYYLDSAAAYRYVTTNFAQRYTQASGAHFWYTAASGTAGNAITFTQAMTLEGTDRTNLLVGTTSSLSGQAGRTDLSVNGSSTAIVSLGVAGARQGYFYTPSVGAILAAENGTLSLTTTSSQAIIFNTNNAQKAIISAAGGFSVGTSSDPGAGAIYATGNITAYYSDARLKTVSGKIENALDKVAQLSGVYYTNNDTAKSFGYDSDEVQVGVIAQEVEAVLPQIVKAAPFDLDENNNSKSGENYKTVQYEKLIPLLIEAINELRAEVKALKGA